MYCATNLQAFAFAIGMAFAQRVLKFHGCRPWPIKVIDAEERKRPTFSQVHPIRCAGHHTNCSCSLIPFLTAAKERNTHDHDTRQLWDMWRKRALSRAVMTMPLSEALTTIEEEGLSTLGRDETACTRSTFEQMVQREMKLLENGCE
jgi:hypothetical protein